MTAARADSPHSAPRPLLVRRGLERRPIVLVSAAFLFVAIFWLREATNDPGSGIALLYALPVALLALELGMLAGLGAAVLATGLLVVWAATSDADLDFLGVATRGAVFAAMGLIAGRFSDRMRAVYLAQGGLIETGLELSRLDEAAPPGDLVVHRAVSLPGVRGARVAIEDFPAAEAGRIGAEPLRFTLDPRGPHPGQLEVEFGGATTERVALDILALQASIALENRRLLKSERERARLAVALREVSSRLEERRTQLETVLEDQERERRHVAHELHEGTGQALVAVLLGLDGLQRGFDPGLSAAQAAELRDHLAATVRSVRELAVRLRPPALGDLGLAAALERLAEPGNGSDVVALRVELGSIADRLPPHLETAIYRIVEDATRATAGARRVSVDYDESTMELTVHLVAPADGAIGNLVAIRARTELLGGSLNARGREIEARIPVERE